MGLSTGCEAGPILPPVPPPFDGVLGLLMVLAIGALLGSLGKRPLESWLRREKADTAARIARERYARGEISKEDFQTIVQTISQR